MFSGDRCCLWEGLSSRQNVLMELSDMKKFSIMRQLFQYYLFYRINGSLIPADTAQVNSYYFCSGIGKIQNLVVLCCFYISQFTL